MKISTKLGGMMLGIIISTVILMIYTLSGLSHIITVTKEQQNSNSPIMIKSLLLQKDIIQIQQWLTDISATRGEEGFDDGFIEAENYYASAKDNLGIIKELGAEPEVIETIDKNLDDYYQMGIDMANAYINSGTDDGNAFMLKFDPYAVKMEESVEVLLNEADNNFKSGSNTIYQWTQNLYYGSIILFSLVILIGIIAYFIIQKTVIRRLHMVTNILKEISEGEGDLTKRIHMKSKDEIGNMSIYFNNFIQTVHSIVSSVNTISLRVSSASEELTASAQQSATTAEEVAQTINEIAKGASDQAKNTMDGSEKLIVLGNLIEDSKKHIEIASETSNEVNELVEQGIRVMGKLTEKTNESNSAVKKVYESIIRTNESSEKISEASSLITSIAKRTKLIALNASIEASRAGEHGNSFQVVAEEIRKLAEQSSASTKIIDDMANALNEDANSAVVTMKEVEKTFGDLEENVNLTETKYNEITKAIKKSSENVEAVNQIGKQMEQRKNEVQDIMQTLHAVAQENAAGTEQTSASMEEQSASIEDIALSSANLTQLFQELQVMIERFKIK